MRIRRIVAVLILAAVFAVPLRASAVDWEEWKFLIRTRPVAVLVAVPPLILTAPFMGLEWLFSSSGNEDEDEG